MWCTACNAIVEAVVETGISHIVVPVIGTAVGGLIGAAAGEGDEDTTKRVVAGGLIGAFVGAVGHAIARNAVPLAQKLVCGTCGCSHLEELAA
jgi:hypothetical protein